MSKLFHIGDILSVTTGRLFSPDGVDGIYRIINYMTGVPHYIHQLPRGADVCKPHLMKQHPWLAEIAASDCPQGSAGVAPWLAGMAETYGEWHGVEQLPFGAYTGRNPLTELLEMMSHDH